MTDLTAGHSTRQALNRIRNRLLEELDGVVTELVLDPDAKISSEQFTALKALYGAHDSALLACSTSSHPMYAARDSGEEPKIKRVKHCLDLLTAQHSANVPCHCGWESQPQP